MKSQERYSNSKQRQSKKSFRLDNQCSSQKVLIKEYCEFQDDSGSLRSPSQNSFQRNLDQLGNYQNDDGALGQKILEGFGFKNSQVVQPTDEDQQENWFMKDSLGSNQQKSSPVKQRPTHKRYETHIPIIQEEGVESKFMPIPPNSEFKIKPMK